MEKISALRIEASKLLAVGVASLASISTLVGARNGGAGRILANAPNLFVASIVFVTLSVVLAIFSIVATSQPKTGGLNKQWWLLFCSSVLAFLVAVSLLVAGQVQSSRKFERPSLGALVDKTSVKVTAELPLLKADEKLTVIVAGFVDPAPNSPIQTGQKGYILFRSTTGPAADGTAKVESTVPLILETYSVVEVRAYRGDTDPGCLEVTDPTTPAACLQAYLKPLPYG